MIGGDSQGSTQFSPPLHEILARTGVDQVEGHAGEQLSRQGQGSDRFSRRVLAAQRPKRGFIQTLNANRYAVDASRAKVSQTAGLDAGWIGFQGNFQVVCWIEPAHCVLKQAGNGRWIHQARSTPTEEDRSQSPTTKTGCLCLQFLSQSLAEAGLIDSVPNMRVEVAIGTFG